MERRNLKRAILRTSPSCVSMVRVIKMSNKILPPNKSLPAEPFHTCICVSFSTYLPYKQTFHPAIGFMHIFPHFGSSTT